MRAYHKGFWDWCKEKYPSIVKEFYEEMKQGIDEMEKFVEKYEREHGK